jgi:hypothetical protein
MLDPIVLLTPFLVLVVILLLGFAGCSARVYGSWPYPLSVVVRVPTTLTVTLLRFDWTDPEGDSGGLAVDNPTPEHQEGDDNVFSRLIQRNPSPGEWTGHCELTVLDGQGSTATDQEPYEFLLVPEYRNVTFRVSGTPADQNFEVMWGGLS